MDIIDFSDKQQERFWTKVNKTDTCWLWTGCCGKMGYGHVRCNDINYAAHRMSWIISGKHIKDSTDILLHKCDNKRCVNPDHLELRKQILCEILEIQVDEFLKPKESKAEKAQRKKKKDVAGPVITTKPFNGFMTFD
jgi:hypothetical protein